MVTVDESGTRREWGFGELNARSAGLAGALEARGVEPRRRRHDPDRKSCRVGAGDARLLPDRRRRAPLQHAAPSRRPRPPGHGSRPGAGARRGALARAAPRRHRLHGPRRDRRDPRRGAPAGAAGDSGRPRPRRSGADRLHVGNDRPGAGRGPPTAVPARPAPSGGALVRRPPRRAGMVHRGHGLVEVGAERVHRTLAGGSGRLSARGPLRPRRAARDLRARGHQRALSGADRVPDARQADRAAAGPLAATAGQRRRAAQRRGDRRLPRRARPRHPRWLRTDRDRSADRRADRRRGPRRLDGEAAPRHRAPRRGRRAAAPDGRAVRRSSAITSAPNRSPASGGTPATSSAPTTTATSGSRAEATT